jgi:hypothetical protein
VRTATVVVDSTLATFTSANQAAAIAENSGANQLVYTAAATDASALTYSLKAGVADQSAFTINASTGQVRLVANPNFEFKSSYGFTVVAKDAADNISEKAVTLGVQDVNEAPTAVALTTALNGNRIDENPSTSARIKVADVVITDDALGTETVTLTGADAAAFEVEREDTIGRGAPIRFQTDGVAGVGARDAVQLKGLQVGPADRGAGNAGRGGTKSARHPLHLDEAILALTRDDEAEVFGDGQSVVEGETR